MQPLHTLENTQYLGTGCGVIDHWLGGGMLPDSLVELVGEAGTGKTQLALQICLHSIATHPQHYSMFISTNKRLDQRRYDDLKKYMATTTGLTHHHIDSHLIVKQCKTVEQFESFIQGADEPSLFSMLRNFPVRVLVVDTLCHLYELLNDETLPDQYELKEKFLRSSAGTLKLVAEQFSVVVVNVNNVVADIESMQQQNRAAMGREWTNLINERLSLSRDRQSGRRTIVVTKSARLPPGQLDIRIDQQGFFGLT